MTNTPESASESIESLVETVQAIESEIGKVIVGQREIVRGVLTCIVARGHVLLEGVPGLGKTLLVRALAESLDLGYSRVQFTPDLMPADIVGTNIIVDTGDGGKAFRFEAGPVFANVVLADEINRATPKTQSALLEAMQEQTVTVGKTGHALPQPFFVLATQNPLEMEGTYPLPEAQLDRFFFKLLVDFPSADDLGEILTRTTGTRTPRVAKVADAETLLRLSGLAREVPIADHVRDYAVSLVMATHPERGEVPKVTSDFVRYGASPRGAQALILASKISALLDGRYNVAFSDIRAVAPAALRHRLILNFQAEMEGVTPDRVIADLIERVPEE